MITWMRTMIECQHTASRVERYLDADPSAPLREDERQRLARHLVGCVRCSREAARHQVLRASLRRLGEHHRPNAAAVARLQRLVHAIATTEHPA